MDMDESFMLLRNGQDNIIASESDQDDNSIINRSDCSSNYNLQRLNSKTPNAKSMIIPESDCDDSSDDDNTVDSPLVVQHKKKPVRVLIDSESEEDAKMHKNNCPEELQLNDSDDDDDNDAVVMSNATRLSIYGIKPQGATDESDFIQSDNEDEETNEKSNSSDVSLSEMAPNPGIYESPAKAKVDMSIDLTQDIDISKMSIAEEYPVVEIDPPTEKANKSVKIVENESPVIHISSDDEFPEVDFDNNKEMKNLTSTPVQTKIKKFFQCDQTYPNSNVTYVSRQFRENEVNKMNEIKVNFEKVKNLLENMNLMNLPDKGAKLRERKSQLEKELRTYQEKISNLVVQDEGPVVKPFIKDEILSWEDLKKGSKAVQPRTFGTQAMNTHLTQKTLTLEKLKDLHSSLDTKPNDNETVEPPKSLITPLMPHQLYALTWLSWRETQKPRGGILADDMGLGKTLTMISLILHSREKNIDGANDEISSDEDDSKRTSKLSQGGTLVVCPASLLKQWYGEIQSHCKRYTLKVEIHHGLKRETKANRLALNDVVITTYNLVQRDLEKNGTLMRIRWQRVILDEAHIVRNYKSMTAKAVFKLSSWARWCLTGTPVHNKDLDLFALLKFLRCSPFNDIVLWKKWIDNKSTGGQERLTTIMKTLLLRRTKLQLQENTSLFCLPEKKTIAIDVKLSKEEMKVYEKVLLFSKTLFAQFLQQRVDRKMESENGQNNELYYKVHKKMAASHGIERVKSHEILVLLLRLRQICCHAGLIHSMLDDEQYEGDTSVKGDQDNLLNNLSKMNITVEEDEQEPNEPNHPSEGLSVADAISKVLSSNNPVFEFERKSAKIEAVISCLQDNVIYRKGDKAIIVSQWTGMLELIERHIKTLGFTCSTLSGKVPVTTRHEIIKKFNDPNSGIQILLLSLCAGGVGLNLIGANHLLLVDLHWNPQLEAQAQDRIYRVGQKKPVFIYKFMCQGTVEQSIKILQDKKLALSENILTGVKAIQSSKLTIDDLKFMFNMQ